MRTILLLNFLTLLSCFTALTMQENSSTIVRIKTWEDAAQFANMIVAYTTDSIYFGSQNGYPINKSSLKYGLVNSQANDCECGERGYSIEQLLRPTDMCHTIVFVNSKLRNALLFMRPINSDEAEKIYSAIKKNQAQFGYGLFGQERILSCLKLFLKSKIV